METRHNRCVYLCFSRAQSITGGFFSKLKNIATKHKMSLRRLLMNAGPSVLGESSGILSSLGRPSRWLSMQGVGNLPEKEAAEEVGSSTTTTCDQVPERLHC